MQPLDAHLQILRLEVPTAQLLRRTLANLRFQLVLLLLQLLHLGLQLLFLAAQPDVFRLPLQRLLQLLLQFL